MRSLINFLSRWCDGWTLCAHMRTIFWVPVEVPKKPSVWFWYNKAAKLTLIGFSFESLQVLSVVPWQDCSSVVDSYECSLTSRNPVAANCRVSFDYRVSDSIGNADTENAAHVHPTATYIFHIILIYYIKCASKFSFNHLAFKKTSVTNATFA